MRTGLGCAVAVLLVCATSHAQRHMEKLGRGVVAVRTGPGRAYIGWRLLGTDPANIAFNLYRSTDAHAAVKLNAAPLATTTDFVDTTADDNEANTYFVRPVM